MVLDVLLEINRVGEILVYLSLAFIVVIEAPRRSSSDIYPVELVYVRFCRVELLQALGFDMLHIVSNVLYPSFMNPRIDVS